jgi:hypothetical protein
MAPDLMRLRNRAARANDRLRTAEERAKPAEWIKPGARADFRMIAGGPVTHPNREILSEPWQLGHGTWLVKIEGVSGGVCCEPRFLTLAKVTP